MTKVLNLNGQISTNLMDSKIVARGLVNPRGITSLEDGSILVIEAGKGEVNNPNSGRLLKMALNQEQEGFEQQAIILQQQYSMNMLPRMKRDEIMGLADIARGKEQILVSLTNYVQGSKVIRVSPLPVTTVFDSVGNLNSIVYHPGRNAWFGIKPDANVLVEFSNNAEEKVVTRFDDLQDGQDAVPVCVIYEADSQALLVSLFSGEIGQEPSKKGIDFDKTAGQVVRIDIDTGTVTPVVKGLTAPTGIALAEDGTLYVLELCDDFLQPLLTDDAADTCLHGGFKRFSGRLLALDLINAQARVIADKLDTPSNLEFHQGNLLVSEGMGIPGREIPGIGGLSQPLSGFIRRIQLV